MSKKILKAGIVGSGFAAQFHIDALQYVHAAAIEVAGVYSPSPEKRTAFAERNHIRVFNELDKLLQIADVIHICIPPITHEPIAIAALKLGKDVIIEKPFTGYFGDGSDEFSGDAFSREPALETVMESVARLLNAERQSQGRIMYAENWIYAPAIQKEREMLEKTKAQIIWMHGEQSHSGSHSPTYGHWKYSGGGSMIGKGCHPLSAAIYLKYVEGRTRNGIPIRPVSISARVHAITRSATYQNDGYLKTTCHDTEDFALMHVEFQDGTIADLFASELVLGGVHNWLEINASNHRTRCHINPNNAMQAYTPSEIHFKDVYAVEKIETKQGWSPVSPDEGWFSGYQHEMNAFYEAAANKTPVESDSKLAADVIATIYAGYLSAERHGAAVNIQTL